MSDLCIACSKVVGTRQHALSCDACDCWRHRICETLSVTGNTIFIMPPTSKKLEGHIASGLFVRPSFRPSVRHAF